MTESEFNILLINDNSKEADIIQSALHGWDNTSITLEIAETTSDGLDRTLKGGIDLILLDLSRFETHGLEALKELRARSITLPVIVFVGIDDEDVGIQAIDNGAQDYLFTNTMDRDSLRHSIRYAVELWKMAEELKNANRKILEQQESVIEKERLNCLMEQSGSTAHELNQPLTVLLGSICLMKMDQNNPEKISLHLERIEDSGKRIAATVKKIQAIRHDKSRHYLGGASVVKPDQTVPLYNIEKPDNNFKNLNNLFRLVQSRYNRTAA